MSFYTDASLVMIPSGYKDQKVYSAKPVDGSGDLTFSRGSDIEATRIGSDGYIHKAQVNLLLQSNTFSNATWSITAGSSVTGGQSGYDGSSDAWLLTDSGFSAAYCLYQSYASSGVQTVSIYAKQGSTSQIEIDFFGGTGGYIRVELTDGSLHSTLNLIDYSVESVGGGWWRISFASNLSSTSLFRIGCNGAGSVYIQDAQINYGLVAQDYVETTTAAVVSGITNDMPRLNYDPANPTCPSLLLEPSRTNLINHSEWFGGHTLFASNVDTNSLTSPEGVLNGSEVRANSGINLNISTANGYTAGASAYVAKNVGTLTASTYTFSTFVKKTDLNLIQLRAADGSDLTGANAVGSIIDLDTYTLVSQTNCTTTIKPYALGWYRVSITFTATAATWYVGFWYWNKTSITVDGTQGYGVYGSQLELGSYVSSMVPTYGASATRTSESAYKTSATAIIGQTEGTFFAEVDFKDTNADQMYLTLSDGTSNNRIHIGYDASGDFIYCNIRSGGAAQGLLQTAVGPSEGIKKIAVGYKLNDYVLYINGVQVAVDSSALVPACPRLDVGGYFSTGFQYPVKQALLFKTRLQNSDLATLTTL